jgi:hypothetical protein
MHQQEIRQVRLICLRDTDNDLSISLSVRKTSSFWLKTHAASQEKRAPNNESAASPIHLPAGPAASLPLFMLTETDSKSPSKIDQANQAGTPGHISTAYERIHSTLMLAALTRVE